ncbi:GNAT family N-acetyltransferase [Montanilutibacter psychrotolerans]|uniref:N-acetyltransferase n=1 Tax=Montanilutibacter psychrotolerans TaxID=1327343 RepID=A0A3M8SQC8_9GAMM|nr:GNAT family N-acetyltransferase [Lysobacter psychrotolerans]RNF81716.1 N-acetyltransferase [Lysobacter psychrotolerans]
MITTERLRLRRLQLDDAPFILEQVNDPSWLEQIGDRGVHNLDDARGFLRDGPLASYSQHGFGLYLIEQAEDGAPVGLCGLLQRDWLDDVDVGYALMPAYRGRGYAREAVRAVIEHARQDLGRQRVAAFTSPGNVASIGVLESLGFRFQREVRLPGKDQQEDNLVKLFALS